MRLRHNQAAMTFDQTITLTGRIVEVLGVAVIVIGIAVVSLTYLRQLRAGADRAYHQYRRGLGRAILLGLELLVAGDIISTVAIDPSFTSVGVLAVIVAVRTFLSWSLEVELQGRWPWQGGESMAPTGRKPQD
jgi:uncharacterized membrane protein